MRNIKLIIEYDGSATAAGRGRRGDYHPAGTEDTLEKLCGKRCSLQVPDGPTAVFTPGARQPTSIPDPKFSGPVQLCLKHFASRDIRIISSEEAGRLHARFSAKAKKYRYSIVNNRHGTAIGWQYYYHVPMHLDIEAMEKAVKHFEGTHDFAAFMAAGSPVKSTVRTIYEAKMVREGDFIHFFFTGDGFLYNMVRIMAGTLIDVGKGKISPDSIPGIILSRDRTQAGPTAPPHGLTLEEVYYENIPVRDA